MGCVIIRSWREGTLVNWGSFRISSLRYSRGLLLLYAAPDLFHFCVLLGAQLWPNTRKANKALLWISNVAAEIHGFKKKRKKLESIDYVSQQTLGFFRSCDTCGNCFCLLLFRSVFRHLIQVEPDSFWFALNELHCPSSYAPPHPDLQPVELSGMGRPRDEYSDNVLRLLREAFEPAAGESPRSRAAEWRRRWRERGRGESESSESIYRKAAESIQVRTETPDWHWGHFFSAFDLFSIIWNLLYFFILFYSQTELQSREWLVGSCHVTGLFI